MRKFFATSNHPLARFTRRMRRWRFSLPAPQLIVWPLLKLYLAGRFVWYTFRRVFIAEPLFKAYCTKYGRGLHTDIFIHWIEGKGSIIIGDDVLVDGKCGFAFASRFSDNPTLEIGDHTGIGHLCSFTVARKITIGRHCRIASGVWMFDSPGHPIDPDARRAGRPPNPEDARPISIGDNVWIGRDAIIYPGVTVGNNSIISAAAVVTADVPENTVVAGNPARKIMAIPSPKPVDGVPAPAIETGRTPERAQR